MHIEEEKKLLHAIDDYLISIAKYIHLHKFITPTNIEEERKIFSEKNGEYDPQFTYIFPEEEKLLTIIQELKHMKEKYFNDATYTIPIHHLFKEKIDENITKAKLLIAYIHQDFPTIKKYNTLLFGTFDPDIITKSKQILQTYKDPDPQVRGEKLNNDEVIAYIKSYLKTHDIQGVQIKILPMSINKFLMAFGQKNCYLVLSKTLQLREEELVAHLIHELQVHYRRYLNGKSSERKILSYGTAGYSIDEEGLALYDMYAYKRKQYPSFEKKSIYIKYLLLYYNQGKSFTDIVKYIQDTGMSKNLKKAFLMVVNLKKGIKNTSKRESGTIFIKNKIYAEGLERVRKRIVEGNDKELLYQGKIKIDDLQYIHR